MGIDEMTSLTRRDLLKLCQCHCHHDRLRVIIKTNLQVEITVLWTVIVQ